MNRYHYIGALTGGTASKWSSQFNFNIMGTVNNSTPVTPRPGCDREYLAVGTAFSNLFKYDESVVNGDCYLNGWIPLNTTAPTPRGKGFAARINDPGIINSDRILSETGAYTNSDYNSGTLSITASNTTHNTSYNSRGAHILSNPFWAPIDWRLVTGSNLDGTAYKYNPATGTYVAMNQSNVNPVVISTNEAFTVYPLNNTLSSFSVQIPASARVTSSNNEFYRQQQPFEYGMKITATSADNESDYTHIIFDSQFTEGYDNGYDARKMFSSVGVPSIYTRDAIGQRNVILALGGLLQTRSIPLGVAIEYNGSHTLTFEGIDEFPPTVIMWLEDLQTGVIQYLRDARQYSFTASKGDNADRFVLHLSPEIELTVTAAGCAGGDGVIRIGERGGLSWSYELRDEQQQVVAQGYDLSDTVVEITSLSAGSYTLHLHHVVSGYSTDITLNVGGVMGVTAAIVGAPAQVGVGEVFTLTGSVSGAGYYEWQMGDGTSYYNEPVITHAYSMPGSYEVTLTAGNDDCSASVSSHIMAEITTQTGSNAIEGGMHLYASGNRIYIIGRGGMEEEVKVRVYNTLGQSVIATGVMVDDGGPKAVTADVAAGIYYVVLERIGGGRVVQKVMLGGEK
jgi:hypothetical protein